MTDEIERRWSDLQPIAPVIDWRGIWLEQGRAEGRAAASATNASPAESVEASLADRPLATRPTSVRWWNSPMWPAATALATTVALVSVLVDFREVGGLWRGHTPGDTAAVRSSGWPSRSDASLASDTSAADRFDSDAPDSPSDKRNDRNGTAPTESRLPLPEPQRTIGQFVASNGFSKSSWWNLAFSSPVPSLEWRMRFGPGIEGARDAWEYRGRTSVPVVTPADIDAPRSPRPFDRLHEADGVADPQRRLPNLFGGWL